MSSSLSHGTEAGVPFTFIEYRQIAIIPQARLVDWLRSLNVADKKKDRTTLRDRWLYGFRFDAGRQRPQLAWEAYVDSHGLYELVPGPTCMAKEPEERRTRTPGGDFVPLVITSNGQATYWMFVASRVALACASLRELCRYELDPPDSAGRTFASSNGVALPVVDPAVKEASFEAADSRWPALPVVDFLTLGDELRRDYELALNRYLRAIGPQDGMKDDEKKAVYKDGITYTLAKLIKYVVDRDRTLGEHVKQSELATAVSTYEKKLAELTVARERTARWLNAYLRGSAMSLVESWYRRREEAVYDLWLQYLCRVVDRMDESLSGLDCVRNPPPIAEHALSSYAFPVVNKNVVANKTKASIIKKAAAPITGIWSKFLPWYLAPSYVSAATADVAAAVADTKNSVRWINQVLGQEVLHFSPRPVATGHRFAAREHSFGLWHDSGVAAAKRAVDESIGTLAVRRDLLKKTDAFMKASGPARYAAEIATFLQLGLDTINNSFKLAAFIQKPSSNRDVWDYADAAGALNSMIKGIVWDKMSRSAEEGVALTGRGLARAAGLIGIVCDAGVGYRDVMQAASDDDMAAAVFTGLSSLGAVASGVVTLIGLTNPVIGLALLAIQAGASIAAVNWRDSSLTNFLQHCTFGTQFGSSGAPKWADGSYQDWTQGAGGVERQITTLYNLVTSFRVKAYNPTTVDIYLGYFDEDMTIQATFYADTLPASKLSLKFHPGTQATAGTWPSSCELRPFRIHGEVPEGFRVTFDKTWRSDQFVRSYCRVSILRSSVVAGNLVESTIPSHDTKLDSDEQHRFGSRAEMTNNDAGLAYPISGLGNLLNLSEKSSAE